MALPFLLLDSKWRIQRDKDYLERSIFGELDGFGRALVDAGPALNAFFWMDRIRFILFHLVDFARADLNAIPTTRTFVFINHRVHNLNPKIPNYK
jgi:hypothetical protein